jgi:hypothetical protein
MKYLALALALFVIVAVASVRPAGSAVEDPINKRCPVLGKEVAAGRTSVYQKQLIGFCCQQCVDKFEEDPKKYIGKVKEFKKQ